MESGKYRTKTAPKMFNHYIKHYNTKMIRFLHCISEGCYHRQLFQKFEINARTYDDYLHRLHFCLPEHHLTRTRNGHKTMTHFVGNLYHGPDNYLLHTFYLKAITINRCFHAISILQLMAESPSEQLSINDFAKAISDCLLDAKYNADLGHSLAFDPDSAEDYMKSIRQTLDELCRQGLVKKIRQNSAYRYQLAENPLQDLSPDEARQLYLAITFYKNVALLSAPGSWLADTLQQLFPDCVPDMPACQFKNNVPIRMLTEPRIYDLLNHLNRQHLLRQENTRISLPLYFETDYTYNQQYLVVNNGKALERWRLDNQKEITCPKASPQKPISPQPPTAPDKKGLLQLRFFPKSASHQRNLCQMLRKRQPDVTIQERPDGIGFDASFLINDWLNYLPWLRSLHPYVEILDSPDKNIQKLRQRMKKDIEEVLNNYAGII